MKSSSPRYPPVSASVVWPPSRHVVHGSRADILVLLTVDWPPGSGSSPTAEDACFSQRGSVGFDTAADPSNDASGALGAAMTAPGLVFPGVNDRLTAL